MKGTSARWRKNCVNPGSEMARTSRDETKIPNCKSECYFEIFESINLHFIQCC